METKEQILNKIKELQEIVDKMPDEPKGLWKPKNGDKYFCICGEGCIWEVMWKDTPADYRRYSAVNVIRTEEEAVNKKESIKVHQQLKDIAHELNGGQKIDWKETRVYKYFLTFDHNFNNIDMCQYTWVSQANTVYCLSDKFKDVAIERIGKEKLERYLKEGF